MYSKLIILFITIIGLTLTNPTQINETSIKSLDVKLTRRHGDHSHASEERDHEHEDAQEKLVCGTVETVEFSQSLHIGCFFLVLAVSGLGCGFTGILNKLGILKIPQKAINVFRHFGTGVIISTAFIHMFMASIASFMHECAPKFTKETYISIGPLITMSAAFLVHLIETVILTKMRDINKEGEGATKEDFQIGHDHGYISKQQKISTYILELGILSHSIFIGIALGVTADNELWALLVAICFHQFFEGLGLGARIAEIPFASLVKPTVMVLFYTLTTPLGVLIGILIRNSYSSSSTSGLIIQGTFDAISAGILIYTGLVELMGRELSVTNDDFKSSSWSTRSLYLFSVYLGAAAMAIIGIWA